MAKPWQELDDAGRAIRAIATLSRVARGANTGMARADRDALLAWYAALPHK